MIYNNYYFRDFLSRTKHLSENAKFDSIIKDVVDIDSIMDYDIFKKYVINNIKPYANGKKIVRYEFGDEGLFYGQRNALFAYAKIETNEQRFILPAFEHGPDLRENVNQIIKNQMNHSFVFSSNYKKKIVHKDRPLAPVFDVGPYVLYADGYYDDNTFRKIKSNYGKIALLFPAHSFEGASVKFDKQQFVCNVMNKFRDSYDTVFVSVYWNDVDDSVYELFEKEGAKLVSAGFRGDPNFIYRLREMIDLSDVVASNMIGSYIGYAIALNKPFFMFEDSAELKSVEHSDDDKNDKYTKLQNDIKYAFSCLEPNDKQIQLQEKIYTKFWGGKQAHKTVEEIKNIITLSQKLLKNSYGTTWGYEKVINKALKHDFELTEDEFSMLLYSLDKKEG